MFRRVLIGAGVVLAGACIVMFADTYRGEFVQSWRQWFNPPVSAPTVGPMGQEILRSIDNERVKEVAKEYGRVEVKLNAAKAKGFRVDQLQDTMNLALTWGREGKYREAMTLINMVEMRIPRKPEGIRPADGRVGVSDQKGRIKGAPVHSKKKKKTAKKKP